MKKFLLCHFKYGILKVLLCLALQFSFLLSNSQSDNHTIDSLKKKLYSAPDDSNRVILTFQIGRSLWFRRLIPEAVTFLQQSVRLSDEKKFFTYAADARVLLANAFINLEKYDSSFGLLTEAMNVARRRKQEENIPKINYTYCYLYNLLGDNNKALEYGLLAADGYEKSSAPEINMQCVYAWIEIGHIFENQGNYQKALYYFDKALTKAKTSNKDWYLRPAMINIANIYVKQNRFNDARVFYNNAIKMEHADQGVEYKIWGFSGLGDIAIIEKKYSKAISYYKDALAIAIDHSMKTNIDNCLCRTGYAFLLDKQFDSAEVYLKQGLKYAIESGGTKTIEDSYNYLSTLYEGENKHKEALYYAHLYKQLSDSNYNKSKLTVINNLEALYQTNKKEKEIIRLQANNTEKQLELFKRNQLLWITAIIIGALLIVFLIQWRTVKNKNLIGKQQQKVMILKSMLDGQNMERTRIAKDLHDGLGGLFSTIKMHMSTLQHENKFLKQDELFQKSYKLIDTASEDLRHIAHNMMPEVLQKLGLMQALKDFCSTINTKNSLQVSLLDYGMEQRLSLQIEIIIYRIVQELLSNVIKHSNATEAILQFNRSGNNINITVEDNGSGFVVQSPKDKLHTGIDIIK